jgi:hypothetical protein
VAPDWRRAGSSPAAGHTLDHSRQRPVWPQGNEPGRGDRGHPADLGKPGALGGGQQRGIFASRPAIGPSRAASVPRRAARVAGLAAVAAGWAGGQRRAGPGDQPAGQGP